jgi:glycosyltransferase involved in cell wall biosynthesis
VDLEAMACGTPVLAGNADGSADALDGGRLGKLVNPRSVPEIAAGLIALLRGEGSDFWFDRDALHGAVIDRFGRDAFRMTLAKILEAA